MLRNDNNNNGNYYYYYYHHCDSVVYRYYIYINKGMSFVTSSLNVIRRHRNPSGLIYDRRNALPCPARVDRPNDDRPTTPSRPSVRPPKTHVVTLIPVITLEPSNLEKALTWRRFHDAFVDRMKRHCVHGYKQSRIL